MYMHLSAYSASLAAGPNLDTAVVADEVIGTRNNHLIFTDQYRLLAAQPIGALLNRARFGNASLQKYSFNHLHPLTVSATQPTNPQFMDCRESPIELPQNEELTVELGNSGAGPTQSSVLLALAADGWSMNLPRGAAELVTRATAVVAAGSETTWGPLANLVFERDLINGVYSVVGCSVVAANALAFRLRFPDMRSVNGKQHRPGWLVQDTNTTYPNAVWRGGFGEWGRFHTFSPPQIQTLADAAGGTYEVRLNLVYLGSDKSLLDR
jgi:hypothetical protein